MIRVNLTETQRQDLRRRARQEIGRISERFHFVLLADQGHSLPEIARTVRLQHCHRALLDEKVPLSRCLRPARRATEWPPRLGDREPGSWEDLT